MSISIKRHQLARFLEGDPEAIRAFEELFRSIDGIDSGGAIPTKHSQLELDDGTNPHGTTASDITGLSPVATSGSHSDLSLDDGANPHGTTASDIPGFSEVATSGLHSSLTLDDGTNPHNTGKGDIGLGNVVNELQLTKAEAGSTATGEGASLIAVEDAAGNFVGTTVEDVVAELASELTLTFNGDVSGSSSFQITDGTVTITVTVLDDSHTHDIRYYTKNQLTSVASGEGASLIGINDAGSRFDSSTVEGALQEAADYSFTNREEMAEKLGYASYADMVQKAASVGTIVTSGGYLSANVIDSDTISADMIAAGAVGTKQLTAGAVTANNLTVLARNNVNNPTLSGNINGWGGIDETGAGSATSASYDATEKALKLSSSGNQHVRCDTFPIDPNKIYRVKLRLKKSASHGLFYIGLSAFTAWTAGTNDAYQGQGTEYLEPIDESRTVYSPKISVYYIAGTAPTSYQEYELYILGANRSENEFPDYTPYGSPRPAIRIASAETGWAALRFLNWDNTIATDLYIKDISVSEVGGGTLVAENIKVGIIDAVIARIGQIAANHLEADEIDSFIARLGFIESRHVSTDLLTALVAAINDYLVISGDYGYLAQKAVAEGAERGFLTQTTIAIQQYLSGAWVDELRLGSVIASGDPHAYFRGAGFFGGLVDGTAMLSSKEGKSASNITHSGGTSDDLLLVEAGSEGTVEIEITSTATIPSVGDTGPALGDIVEVYDTGFIIELAPSVHWQDKIWAPQNAPSVPTDQDKDAEYNTDLIYSTIGPQSTDYAAQHCVDVTSNGYSDFFMAGAGTVAAAADLIGWQTLLGAAGTYVWAPYEDPNNDGQARAYRVEYQWQLGSWWLSPWYRAKSLGYRVIPVRSYQIQDEFRYRENGGTWSSAQPIVANEVVTLPSGTKILFEGALNHTVGETWELTIESTAALSLKDVSGNEYMRAANGQLTVDSLVERASLGTTVENVGDPLGEVIETGTAYTDMHDTTGLADFGPDYEWLEDFLPGEVRLSFDYRAENLFGNIECDFRVLVDSEVIDEWTATNDSYLERTYDIEGFTTATRIQIQGKNVKSDAYIDARTLKVTPSQLQDIAKRSLPHQGNDDAETDFPVGHTVMVGNGSTSRLLNSTQQIYISSTHGYSVGAASPQLAGTWAKRGEAGLVELYERIS